MHSFILRHVFIHLLTEIYMLNSTPRWSHLSPLNWPLLQYWLSLLMAFSLISLVSSLATLFSPPWQATFKTEAVTKLSSPSPPIRDPLISVLSSPYEVGTWSERVFNKMCNEWMNKWFILEFLWHPYPLSATMVIILVCNLSEDTTEVTCWHNLPFLFSLHLHFLNCPFKQVLIS